MLLYYATNTYFYRKQPLFHAAAELLTLQYDTGQLEKIHHLPAASGSLAACVQLLTTHKDGMLLHKILSTYTEVEYIQAHLSIAEPGSFLVPSPNPLQLKRSYIPPARFR